METKKLSPPFTILNTEEKRIIATQLKVFNYKKKQIIHRAGLTPQGLFIVRKGKVKIYKIADSAKEIIIHIAGAGEMVGYSALMRDSEYHFWAEAIDNCELDFIPKKLFYELIEEYPKLSIKLMHTFFTQYDRVIDKMVDILSDQVRKRTAKTLLWLMQTHGLEEDRKTISIVLSRNDLAHLVATNTETLVRTLSDFKSENIISVKGKKISITNHEKLSRIVHLP
ncbi:MAG: Crp/Fnr family transcriptional regulator [Bacteroidia bacterium]|nr:Crp/Fnr family transcriptional regulator [Bacteroidia bacterium]